MGVPARAEEPPTGETAVAAAKMEAVAAEVEAVVVEVAVQWWGQQRSSSLELLMKRN